MDPYEYDMYDVPAAQPLHGGLRRSNTKYGKMTRRKWIALMVFAPLGTLILGILLGTASRSKTQKNCPTNEPADPAIDVKDLLFKNMEAENIKDNLRKLSDKVHMAGSTQDEKVLVDLLVERWKDQLDEVKIYPYNVLLSFPNASNPNYMAVRGPGGNIYNKSDIYEPSLTASEDFENVPPTFNAYGAAGHVEGDMVFVNYAHREDFKTLNETSKVDVRGKICIAKYGKLFRGDKALHAEIYGCSGLVLFTDPADYEDMEDVDSTFPESWWMPHSGVQRGSVFIVDGDPLTPFFPANEYAYRIPESETNLPKIPVQPISSDNAFLYLSKLGGQDAPQDWQGGMNLTYKLGGEMAAEYENHTFILHVGNYRPQTEIRNVVGYIWGSEEPDRHVIVGNHRDAWVFGAVDPSSGTAVMMEMARALGELVKTGKWRPRRTIIFCSWAAEEYGLIGSIEWTEEFEKKLLLEAVACLNVDIAVEGNATFGAMATPNIRKLLYNVTKEVANPDPAEIANQRPTVFDTWKKVYYDTDNKSQPYVGHLGSGSDYVMFLQKTGVSSVDMRYTYDEIKLNLSSYPIYHSAHETIEYFEKFLDPEYKFSLAMAQIWIEVTRRIADDVIIPFDPLDYAIEIKGMIDRIEKEYTEVLKQHGINLDHLHSAVYNLGESAKTLLSSIPTVNGSNFLEARQLNDKLMFLDRAFLDFNGLPGRPYYRHIVFAPSSANSYSGAGFSGFVDAIYDANENGDWEGVKQQLATITHHLQSASAFLVPF